MFRILTAFAFVAALAIVALPITASSDDASKPASGTMSQTGSAADCQAMMKRMQEMHTKVEEMDAKLGRLAAAMNAATGDDDKIAATMGVVNEMVTQRTSMHQEMAMMQHAMMEHMAIHIGEGPQALQNCPMMHGMSHETGGHPAGDGMHTH